MRRGAGWLLAASVWAQGGCALTNKAEALSPRYFTAEPPASAATETTPSPLSLRLGQIGSSSHLEERMQYRVSEAELGYYDDRRWTEAPEDFLHHALSRELFERRGLGRILTGIAPTLDVELTAFEEVRGPEPKVRLALTYLLRNEARALVQRSFVLERPLPAGSAGDPGRVASGLSVLLGEAVSRVANDVVRELEQAPPPVSAAPTAVPADDPP